jgi:hypothetical protein
MPRSKAAEASTVVYAYRYTGEAEALIPELHRIVRPGEEFESPVELNNADLEPVAPKKE